MHSNHNQDTSPSSSYLRVLTPGSSIVVNTKLKSSGANSALTPAQGPSLPSLSKAIHSTALDLNTPVLSSSSILRPPRSLGSTKTEMMSDIPEQPKRQMRKNKFKSATNENQLGLSTYFPRGGIDANKENHPLPHKHHTPLSSYFKQSPTLKPKNSLGYNNEVYRSENHFQKEYPS